MPPARCTSDVIVLRCRRHFRQTGRTPRNAINVGHGEIDLGFAGSRQQVQDCIGGTTHRHIQGHGIFECRLRRDAARQHTGIILLVVAAA